MSECALCGKPLHSRLDTYNRPDVPLCADCWFEYGPLEDWLAELFQDIDSSWRPVTIWPAFLEPEDVRLNTVLEL